MIQVPFDKDGNQVDWHNTYSSTLQDNFEFEDTLQYMGYSKGRSSVTFEFERLSNGKKVTMFISDFNKIASSMRYGALEGKFTFGKKGTSYGCKLIESAKPKYIKIMADYYSSGLWDEDGINLDTSTLGLSSEILGKLKIWNQRYDDADCDFIWEEFGQFVINGENIAASIKRLWPKCQVEYFNESTFDTYEV